MGLKAAIQLSKVNHTERLYGDAALLVPALKRLKQEYQEFETLGYTARFWLKKKKIFLKKFMYFIYMGALSACTPEGDI